MLIIGFELVLNWNTKESISSSQKYTNEEILQVENAIIEKIRHILTILNGSSYKRNIYILERFLLEKILMCIDDVENDDVSKILLTISNVFKPYNGWKDVNGDDFNLIILSPEKYFIINNVVSPEYM